MYATPLPSDDGANTDYVSPPRRRLHNRRPERTMDQMSHATRTASMTPQSRSPRQIAHQAPPQLDFVRTPPLDLCITSDVVRSPKT